MECTNTYCTWSAFGQCCHESKEGYEKATPNELDCPSSLRRDFEEQLYFLAVECMELINHRNWNELLEIKKFIESQREGN